MLPYMFIHRYTTKAPGNVLPRRGSGNHYAKTGKGSSSFQKFNCPLLCTESYLIYFDLELLLLPVYGPQPDPEKSSTQTLEIHQPCGYALAVVKFGKREVLKFDLKRGENVMKELIASLESLAKQIYLERRKYYTFTGTPSCTLEEAHTC